MRVASLVFALASAVGACDPGATGADRTVVRDSAGIEIIESETPAWTDGEGWTLPSEPVLHIGVADGDSVYQFHEIRGAVLMADGRIAVANNGSNTIRYYDETGTFIRETGGAGTGPGKFENLASITATAEDSLIAYDSRLKRISVLSPQGEIVRSIVLNLLQTAVPLGRTFRLSSGAYIAGGAGFSSQQLNEDTREPGIHRPDAPIFRISADGGSADTVGMFPGMEIAMRQSDRGFSFGPPPFGRHLYYHVHDDLVFVGTAERLEVRVYGEDGRLRRIVRGPATDLEITQQDIDEHHEAMLDLSESRGFDRATVEASFADEILPPARAAYTSMLVDDEGNLWLATDAPTAMHPPTRWTVFDAGGALLGDVVVPPGFRLSDVRGGRVLARSTDEFDVEYVDVFLLQR